MIEIRPATTTWPTPARVEKSTPPDRGWLAICAIVLGLQCLPPSLRDALVHDRAAIAAGHAWRIVTGQFVHLGWVHASFNAVGLAACAWLAGRDAGGVRTIAVLACATGGWLWLGVPQLVRYAGLSGVVYGAAACALISAAGRRIPAGIALAALVALAVRVGWQGLHGAPAAQAAWLGGPVAPAAHSAGFVAGVVWASAMAWRSRGRRDSPNGRMDRRVPPAQNSGSSKANGLAAPPPDQSEENFMAYMLLIVEPTGQRAERTLAEGQALYARMQDFAAGLKARGVLRAVESLETSERGTRVQVRDGETRLIDGPFAEAKEMVGGFFLVDVDTHAEALEIARQCPAAQWCTVEVRAVGPCFL